ncbi:MAG: hypothetical protein GY822_24090 [Deltaproteobacteria bacterium]|nr:hypothetical protein [Deltaproteobacteria bacterium]
MTTSWAMPAYLAAAMGSSLLLFVRAWTQQKSASIPILIGIFVVIALLAAAEVGLWRHLERLRDRVRVVGPEHEALIGDANFFVAFLVTPLWFWRRFSLSNALSTAMFQKPTGLLWAGSFVVFPSILGIVSGAGSYSKRQAAPMLMGLCVMLFAFLTARQLWRLHVGLAMLEGPRDG